MVHPLQRVEKPTGDLFEHAVAVKKLLGSAEWGLMQDRGAFLQAKAPAELGMQSICVIPNHLQAAASLGPLRTECADNDMAAWPYRS